MANVQNRLETTAALSKVAARKLHCVKRYGRRHTSVENKLESNPFLMLSSGAARLFKDTPKRVGPVVHGRTNVN
ncbi:hypothetical protein ACVMIH_002275 [Bradyrhizobium sp. USDA 4503]